MILRLLFKLVDRWKLLLGFFLMIVASFNGVVLSSIIVYASKFSENTTVQDITMFGIFSFLGWCVVYLARYFLTIITASIIKQANISLKQNYFWHEFSSFGFKKDSSEVISGLSNDWKLIETNYYQSIFSIMSNSMLFIVSLIYMLYMNALTSVIFIIFSFLPMIVPKLLNSKLKESANSWSSANEQYIKRIKEYLQGMSVLKAYSVLKETYSGAEMSLENVEKKSYELFRIQSFAEVLSAILSGISFIFPFVIGCYLIIFTNSLSISILIAIFLANDRIVGPLREIATGLNRIGTTVDLRTKYFVQASDFIKESKRNESKDSGQPKGLKLLDLKNVKYQMNEQQQLHLNINLHGHFKAVIYGDSGSGKTTLLNLIRGVIHPNSGEIHAVSQDNTLIDISKEIAYIEQTPYIFDATVKDNITLFQNHEFSEQEVTDTLKAVSLYDELGKDQSLGFICGDTGNKLSGGQKQRIEIARALIRHKALYLVDEITANLDVKNATQIREILFRLKVPVIEVAHHFNANESQYTHQLELKNGELVLKHQ